jgi:ABC-type transport system involved in cytochrome c biogenesis permease component
MSFLPIVDRELRVASRRNGTYRTRLAVALAASVISGFLLYFYAANPGITRQLLGQYLFRALSGLALAYSLFAGRLWTADCLSEERRQGTLGLLFLTDLRGYDVVFGKVVATSLNGFYGCSVCFLCWHYRC